MRSTIILFSLIGVLSVLSSCKKDDDSDKIALENRLFEAYLENNNITAEPKESGLYYIENEAGTGLTPLTGDWVLIKYDLILINNDRLIYTSDREKAIDYNLYDERLIYGRSKLQVGSNLEGLDEGLQLMKEGGKSTLLFKSDLGYGKQGSGVIGPYNSLRIDVELIEVIEDPIAYENERIENYLVENNYAELDSMENGMYYIEIEEGTGDSVQNNAFVTVNVEGFLIDGRRFLDEDVFRFQIGIFDLAVTEGLNEGVKLMKELGKSRFIVPYYLGYGSNGKSYYEGKAKVPIPPYSTLIYDVELLNAK